MSGFMVFVLLSSIVSVDGGKVTEERHGTGSLLLLMITCSKLIINLTLGLGRHVIFKILQVAGGEKELKPQFTV